jgi:hypothetical protein
MATPSPTSRPSWQRNPVFEFFASLKLAVVLLAVLIVGAIAGTLWESSFDAKVARAYVYGAPWFNVWLILLAANLAVSALSRWPWRKHHVAFLVTHLGIITLLGGSLIGRTWGIEGTITLFKGEPPSNRLLVDQHQLRVRDTDGVVKGYPVEFVHRAPTPQKPWDLGLLAGGGRLSIIDYAPAIEGKLNPKALQNGGKPALHFTIATAMMGQRLDNWLMADDREHGSFSMGLATIELKRGAAPAETKTDPSNSPTPATSEVEIEEAIFAFAKAPEEQIAKVIKGGNSGAKVQLSQPENGNKGSVLISLNGKTWTFDVAQNLGKDAAMDGTAFTVRVDNYWADFRMDNGKPTSVSDQPNNPATVVTLRGKGIPAAPPATDPHTDTKPGAAPAMPENGAATANHLTLYLADDGAVTYAIDSRKTGRSTGKLELNAPLATGWADWQLTVDRTLAHAEEWMDFIPTTAPATGPDLPDGVRIRIEQGGKSSEQWVPAGWQISVPAGGAEVPVAYGWKQIPLPIGLELLDFEVQRNEGSDSPAGFKSTVRVSSLEGQTATGQCWMNNPFNFPGAWWNTWSGLTFKMSQASWNPENLGQSTIQILRDPGWLLKWIGSLLIVSGIFMLFYVKKFRRPAKAGTVPPVPEKARRLSAAATALVILFSLSGCSIFGKNSHHDNFAPGGPWGYYSGTIDTRWDQDGRSMTLLNELRYTDPKGVVWIAPAGSVIDGASIPRALWSFMGGPFEGKYRNASVLHDVAYDLKNRPPAVVDRMFYDAMRCSGVGAVEAKTMYYALLRFGRHWKFSVKKAKPVLPDSSPDLVNREPRTTTVDPHEVDAIQQWIRQNNPSLDQIESRVDAKGR